MEENVIRRVGTLYDDPMWLSILLCLFICRVLAQLLQVTYPVSWLPEVQHWQGSSLPYPVLLASIVLVLAHYHYQTGQGVP